ncbi:hypothetical protein R5W24_005090 [Gemmata sp. JC717]|uniref:hypothetical protein n=1 Tax=Gemmata algarum TaxID=2975278 RepID=UPI0021BAFB1D|nr:hypothetical protein [Gemmata algarum]MDY3555944.1 hypothetical protein [Gemmata algarum]
MSPIRLIRDTAELSGTCYFEFLPGPYRGRCWNAGSVFLAEDVFGLIEPVIARHVPEFDHYSFVAVGRATWERVIPDLGREAAASADRAFGALAGELAAWLREQLDDHECVSVLGM